MSFNNVIEQYNVLIKQCRGIFEEKMNDYGPTWLVFRWDSLVDQIWIKAKRIRTLEENEDKSLVPEGREEEYMGIINYSIIALVKIYHKDKIPDSSEVIETADLTFINEELILGFYDSIAEKIRILLEKKNHDYGDAWKQMSIYSITDQIFVKLLRIKNILKNNHKLKISEDIDAQFSDIINYSIFGLIKLDKKSSFADTNIN
jgi:hypothetical protein